MPDAPADDDHHRSPDRLDDRTIDRVIERALRATGRRTAVATPHHEATWAAERAFEAGGNAIDAALAAAATLAVAYPQMCGIGGDVFALVQTPTKVVSVNSTGASPAALDAEAIRAAHDSMPVRGPFAVTVPGAVAGWEVIHGLGARLPWRAAFDHPTHLAADGVVVVPGLAQALDEAASLLGNDPGARAVFTHDGAAMRAGDAFVNPALADTLSEVARDGGGTLYGGDVGTRFCRGLASAGCPMTVEDLAAHRAETLAPLIGRYRRLEVRTSPPTSQGFAMLQALGAVERLGIDPDPLGGDADGLALAFVASTFDRDAHLADPRHMTVSVGSLIGGERIEAIAAEVRARVHRSPTAGPSLGGTAGLVTADAGGFAVSLIQSLAWGFGSGILEPSTGILAQNRGSGFTLDPSHPNALGPSKRPAHTLMPVMAHRDGRLVAVSGTMGGPAHPQINAMSLIRAFDLGMGAADAVAAPRWLAGGMDALEDVVEAEDDVPEDVARRLEDAGLRVTRLRRHESSVGHAHLIVVDDDRFDVGTDPRADGEAASA